MGELIVEVLAGILVGVAMGLVGAGGAVITVPVFGTLLRHPPKAAFLEALAVTGGIAVVSAVAAARSGRLDWRRAGLLAVTGIAGAQLAAPVAVRMPELAQVSLFAVLALVAAWRMWGSSMSDADASDARSRPLRTGAVGAVVGALTSILGVGGGFLLVPALTLWERLPMATAVGTSLCVIATNAASGLVGQWWSGGFAQSPFDSRAVGITVAFGVVGSVVGARIASRVPQPAVRRAFAVLLALAGASLVARHVLGT